MKNEPIEAKQPDGPLLADLSKVVKDIENIYSDMNENACTGIKTGFTDLDLITSGLHPGDLIVVAARPNMGDTTFITNIAENIALDSNLNVVFFSMKMPSHQLVRRMIAATGRVFLSSVHNCTLTDDQWPQLTHSIGRLMTAKIVIIDNKTTEWSVAGLTLAIEEIAADLQPDILIVDGLPYFDVSNVTSSYDRNMQLTEQARQLKKLALIKNIPIVVTASVTRDLETRPNKRPLMRDIRDIGMLEDIADTILFLHRPEVYEPDSGNKGLAEMIVAKQQHGPLGTVNLSFNENICRFDNF
jgi:replicative DNA helicase